MIPRQLYLGAFTEYYYALQRETQMPELYRIRKKAMDMGKEFGISPSTINFYLDAYVARRKGMEKTTPIYKSAYGYGETD